MIDISNPGELYYHVPSSARICFFHEDLVALDLEKNKFRIIPDFGVSLLAAFLGRPSESVDVRCKEAIENAVGCELIKRPFIQNTPATGSNKGLFEQRWTLPVINPRKGTLSMCVRALFCLQRASVDLRTGGYARIVSRVLSNNAAKKAFLNDDEVLLDLIHALNKVFILDWSGNRCLAYSYALRLLALQFSTASSLVIGVRTRPFLAHAWLEDGDGCVRNDATDLRNSMSVILEI